MKRRPFQYGLLKGKAHILNPDWHKSEEDISLNNSMHTLTPTQKDHSYCSEHPCFDCKAKKQKAAYEAAMNELSWLWFGFVTAYPSRLEAVKTAWKELRDYSVNAVVWVSCTDAPTDQSEQSKFIAQFESKLTELTNIFKAGIAAKVDLPSLD